jgi:Resolvase, N terminal domain
VLPTLYDDGGFSGGTMERPALKRLIADIEAGQIDVVVVYKVDRLTRALSDFAKLVEVFDRRGVSFVSITQQFNTTTSMGRLTLNVLLSFAQFEREVISERVRDKVAASKKKGLWMGGMPPLGYDVENRKLVVNEAEAFMFFGCAEIRPLCPPVTDPPSQWSPSRDAKARPLARKGPRCLSGPFLARQMSSVGVGVGAASGR